MTPSCPRSSVSLRSWSGLVWSGLVLTLPLLLLLGGRLVLLLALVVSVCDVCDVSEWKKVCANKVTRFVRFDFLARLDISGPFGTSEIRVSLALSVSVTTVCV